MISIINVPPHKLALEQRLSEATLCFKKKFWLEQKFNDNSIGTEAYEFIKNRNTKFSEISWEKVIVSLLHSRIGQVSESILFHFFQLVPTDNSSR